MLGAVDTSGDTSVDTAIATANDGISTADVMAAMTVVSMVEFETTPDFEALKAARLAELQKMKVASVKSELSKLGAVVSGNKTELIHRLHTLEFVERLLTDDTELGKLATAAHELGQAKDTQGSQAQGSQAQGSQAQEQQEAPPRTKRLRFAKLQCPPSAISDGESGE